MQTPICQISNISKTCSYITQTHISKTCKHPGNEKNRNRKTVVNDFCSGDFCWDVGKFVLYKESVVCILYIYMYTYLLLINKTEFSLWR